MSRSRKKNPYHPICCCESEKKDKRFANRKLRRINRVLLSRDAEVYKHLREVSCVWVFGKDGKVRFRVEDYPQGIRK